MSTDTGRSAMPQNHYARLIDHKAWLSSGWGLLAGSDVIWLKIRQIFDTLAERFDAQRANPDPSFVPLTDAEGIAFNGYCGVYLLNAGYAVEVFLKGLRVKRLLSEQKPVGFGPGPDRLPRHHTGYDTLARVELQTLSEEETRLLQRLGVFVQWAGRYPIPIEPLSVNEVGSGMKWMVSHQKDEIEAFCQRIIDKYNSLASSSSGG